MKTHIKQFKRTATGILSIVAISSVAIISAVPASALLIDKTYTLPKAELKKICTSDNDGKFSNHKGGGYGCSFSFPEEDVDIGCTEDGKCGIIVSKEGTSDNAQHLHQKLQNAERLIAPRTPEKPTILRKKLTTSASGKLKGS